MFNQQDELQEKRLQHQLEIQSMQIEHVFDRHQVPAQVDGGLVKPRSISFSLQTQTEKADQQNKFTVHPLKLVYERSDA